MYARDPFRTYALSPVTLENPFDTPEDTNTVNISIERDCSLGLHMGDSAIRPLTFKGTAHIFPNKFQKNAIPSSASSRKPMICSSV